MYATALESDIVSVYAAVVRVVRVGTWCQGSESRQDCQIFSAVVRVDRVQGPASSPRRC